MLKKIKRRSLKMEELAKKGKVVVVVAQKETMNFFNENFPGLTGKYRRKVDHPYFEAGTMVLPASIEERNRNGNGTKDILFIKPVKRITEYDLFISNGTTDILIAEAEVEVNNKHQKFFSPDNKVGCRRYRYLADTPCGTCAIWGVAVKFNNKFINEFVALVYNIEREKSHGGKLYAAKRRT